MPEPTDTIPGWSSLVDWFGYSPTFHDAVVEKLEIGYLKPSLVQLRTWHMSDETDTQGQFILTKHLRVRLIIDEIECVALNDKTEPAGDILSRLQILGWDHGFIINLESVMDKGGIIVARDLRVEFEPIETATR